MPIFQNKILMCINGNLPQYLKWQRFLTLAHYIVEFEAFLFNYWTLVADLPQGPLTVLPIPICQENLIRIVNKIWGHLNKNPQIIYTP